MISYREAYRIVLEHIMYCDIESVRLSESNGCILAEDIYADRDFPPFDRVTKDGIAIQYKTYENGIREFNVQEIAAAGESQKELKDPSSCIEVMTGAILPKNTDTVIMYEHLNIKNGTAKVEIVPEKGQDIHAQGSDKEKGALLLHKNQKINAAEVGVLASVGKATVRVKKLPEIGVISTGDELVAVEKTPAAHQIRKSNSFTLESVLKVEMIDSKKLHFNDLEKELTTGVEHALNEFDVLLLSGGVSRGKFDFLPKVMEDLGVTKLFHRVKQRPGKPFWFGNHREKKCTIFAFPGNPASTFANYHIYFLPWLSKSLGKSIPNHRVVLNEAFENKTDLTRFVRAQVKLEDGMIKATLVNANGSGDLTSLSTSNGFIRIEPSTNYEVGEVLPFYPTKRIV